MKKSSRRSKEKYPALRPELNLRTRYEQIDFDYLDQLSEKDKKWLNTFMEEYVGASFNHKNVIQKSPKHKKESYDRNNARNRDMLTLAKAMGITQSMADVSENTKHPNWNEDALIKKIDLGNKRELFPEEEFKKSGKTSKTRKKRK